jgi:exopolysaccharide biosynthesis protein
MKLFTIYVDKWAGRSVRTVKHSVRANDLSEACFKAIELNGGGSVSMRWASWS